MRPGRIVHKSCSPLIAVKSDFAPRMFSVMIVATI
jgi:hypothetical protein